MGRRKAAERQRQTHRACLFCGAKPLTDEHMLPKWLADKVGHVPGDTNTWRKNVPSSGGAFSVLKQVPQIPFLRQAVKIVCFPCNSGWMSGLESATKSIISATMVGSPRLFSSSDRKRFVRWAIKTTMIRGAKETGCAAAYPDEHRSLLRDGAAPLPGWHVCIGLTKSAKLWTTHWSFSSSASDDLEAVGAILCTIRIFKLLVVVVFASPCEGAEETRLAIEEDGKLVCLSDKAQGVKFLGNDRLLSDDEVSFYAELFRHLYGRAISSGPYHLRH